MQVCPSLAEELAAQNAPKTKQSGMSGNTQHMMGAPRRTSGTGTTATAVAGVAMPHARSRQRPTRRSRTTKIANKPLRTSGEFDNDETYGWRSTRAVAPVSGRAPSVGDWLFAHRHLCLALGIIAMVLSALYGPAQNYYVSLRTGQVLQAKYDQIASENSSLTNDVARLQTEEGIKAEATKRGYVDPAAATDDSAAAAASSKATGTSSKAGASSASGAGANAGATTGTTDTGSATGSSSTTGSSPASVADNPATDPSATQAYQDDRTWSIVCLDRMFFFDPEAVWNE